MDSYVRVDQTDKYIYFLNDTFIHTLNGHSFYRSKYLLRAKGHFPCVRMKKIFKLPINKRVNV